MRSFSFRQQGFFWTIVGALCMGTAAGRAQTPPTNPSSNANNEWLAQAAKLYYSSSKAGFKGFDCALNPNWQALYSSKSGGSASAADTSAVALLNSVKTALHARMDSSSIVDWNPPAQQFDTTQTALLNQMHDALNQIVQGFMQFWTPFIESQVVPDSSDGLDMAATADGGMKIHVATQQVEVTEVFDSGRILRQYGVIMSGTKIDVTPTYSPSDHGLLISHFYATIQPQTDPQKVQDMNVDITYQWLEGFPIPATLNMNVTGVAGLNVAFENCTVQH
jgi:hypothetical protein